MKTSFHECFSRVGHLHFESRACLLDMLQISPKRNLNAYEIFSWWYNIVILFCTLYTPELIHMLCSHGWGNSIVQIKMMHWHFNMPTSQSVSISILHFISWNLTHKQNNRFLSCIPWKREETKTSSGQSLADSSFIKNIIMT